jgi:hypothetical protein
MFSKTILATALATATAHTILYSDDSHTQHFMFNTFVREFNKQYATPEETQTRFMTFVSNLKIADDRNQAEMKNNGTAVHGINRFMDLSQEEFRANYLGSKLPEEEDKSGLKSVRTSVTAGAGAKTEVDWSGVLTTPVKDQVL